MWPETGGCDHDPADPSFLAACEILVLAVPKVLALRVLRLYQSADDSGRSPDPVRRLVLLVFALKNGAVILTAPNLSGSSAEFFNQYCHECDSCD